MPDMPDGPSDLELIDAINRGDAGAFETLYRRYRDWSVALAFRFTGDRDLALDVMQDAFLYLLKRFPGFRLTAQFKTFFYPVVRHLGIAAAQKSRRFAAGGNALDDLPAPAAAAHASELGASASSDRADLAGALAHLPAGQREVLLLRFVDDLPLDQIAIALEVPLGTVKSRLHNALAALRSDPGTKKYFER